MFAFADIEAGHCVGSQQGIRFIAQDLPDLLRSQVEELACLPFTLGNLLAVEGNAADLVGCVACPLRSKPQRVVADVLVHGRGARLDTQGNKDYNAA